MMSKAKAEARAAQAAALLRDADEAHGWARAMRDQATADRAEWLRRASVAAGYCIALRRWVADGAKGAPPRKPRVATWP